MTAVSPAAAPTQAAGASLPVGDYGLLADCNSAALVSREGSIDWLCLPRYDSPALFARILDPGVGHWSLRPSGEFTAQRRYLPGTLVTETTFTTDAGVVRVRDAMAFAPDQRGHDLGFDAPHELLRSVEGVSGRVELEMELAPRPEYGLVRPLLRLEEDGARSFGGPNRLAMRAGSPLILRDAALGSSFAVAEGEQIGFSLRWAPVEQREVPAPCAPDQVAAHVDDTVEAWVSWDAELDIYDGPHRELVRFSSRVLKGLTYRPTGAIVAAPTTSLFETVGGEHDLSERELPHLRGWRESRPVRVGNGAWDQTQLDVYGELLSSLWLYHEKLGELHPEVQAFVSDLADTAAQRWHETDAGMWEMRGEPRHHLSSKVLCWTALDRAVKLAPALGEHAKPDEWAAARDEIRAAVLERGWSEKAGAYAQSFDADELDAAQLLMPILGFLPADDERMRSTIEAIARELTEDGLVLRYRNEEGLNADGLTGEEGTFVICSFWLVSCLAQVGEIERAEALFEQLAGYANDVGLLAEEIDTANGEQLGNFPQAFSHIGLITAAWQIDQARERAARVSGSPT